MHVVPQKVYNFNKRILILRGGFNMLDGSKIRAFRLSLGYTAKDVERLTKNGIYETSISKSYLEELERGDKRNPSLRKLEVLASVLSCKLDDFVIKMT